jgi:hypothetical protein
MTDTIEVEGVLLGPASDYVALLRRQLKYGTVWNEVGDPGPEEGIWRVFEAASGTPIEKKLIDAVKHLLTDPDVVVRSGAVALAQDYAERMDPTALLQILERNQPLFDGVKPTDSRADSPDLAWGLLRAMTANTGHDSHVIARLRRAAFDTENGSTVLGGLAADDPEWTIAQARHLVSSDPVRARVIMANLPDKQSRERFVKALVGEPATFRRELGRVIADKVADPAEREQLNSIVG